MRMLGRYWLALTLPAAAFAMSAALYPRLPAIIVIHWNSSGANGWAPKWQGAFMGPVLGLAIVGFLILSEQWAKDDGDDAGAAGKTKARIYPVLATPD